MEIAKIVENKGCSSCAIGALCLVDGPLPDFEIIGIMGLMGLFN